MLYVLAKRTMHLNRFLQIHYEARHFVPLVLCLYGLPLAPTQISTISAIAKIDFVVFV